MVRPRKWSNMVSPPTDLRANSRVAVPKAEGNSTANSMQLYYCKADDSEMISKNSHFTLLSPVPINEM